MLTLLFLSLQMAGMQWGKTLLKTTRDASFANQSNLLLGGYQYPWASAHVVAPIVVGASLLIGFICWEVWGIGLCQKHIPGRIKQDPRVLLLTLLITFISGVSFFAAIMFWRKYVLDRGRFERELTQHQLLRHLTFMDTIR